MTEFGVGSKNISDYDQNAGVGGGQPNCYILWKGVVVWGLENAKVLID